MNGFGNLFVTFWHKICLLSKTTNKLNGMNNLTKQYETAKNNSIEFMKTGEITKYFEALLEMKKYKRLMVAIVAN